jgi:uncharacterized protein (DUF1684 family)
MMRSIVLTLTVFVLAGGRPSWSADSFTSKIEDWRKDHDRDVLGPDGPFTLVARFTPKPGVSSLGRDRSNDLVLPVEAAPAHAGKIDWSSGDSAMLRLEHDISAVVDGQKVTEVAISKPVIVTIGEMKLRALIRESELRVSVQDPHARMRKDAKPPVWFPIDLRYRITADWVPFPETKKVRIPDSDGGSREWKSPGYASFMIDGQAVKLQAILTPDGKQLSFLFRDRTAGHETYGAGRFLETDLPNNGKVIVDFNEAYNPYCAYNVLFACPIPPRENHLPVRIEAGERDYPHAGGTP